MWTIFEVFIEFVTILFLLYALVFWPQGMWDLISLTRYQTHTLCNGRQNLNHWTTRKVLFSPFLDLLNLLWLQPLRKFYENCKLSLFA